MSEEWQMKKGSLVLRPMDFRAIKLIYQWLQNLETLFLARGELVPPTLEELKVDFAPEIANDPNAMGWIIEWDKKPIGWARLRIELTRTQGVRGIVIANPEYRRRGIGTEVGKMISWIAFHVKKVDRVMVQTHSANPGSQAMIKKLGGELIEVKEGVVSAGKRNYDALIYIYKEEK